jgi:carbon-monoxide dehydrogenase medium subunit
VKPARFEYFDPKTLGEVFTLLATDGEGTRLLAGGQSLVPLMNMRLARCRRLVDLNQVEDLAYVRERVGGLAIGAMTRQETAERSALVAARSPLLAEALPLVGHPAIRNRGTIGGSLAHADPAAELPACAVALEATVELAGPRGRRTVAAGDFFRGYLETAAMPDEVLTEVVIPALPPRSGCAFQEVARRHGDFALVAVAVVVTADAAGGCVRARLVFAGVGSRPVRLEAPEARLVGTRCEAGAVAAAAEAVRDGLRPESDLHGSADYRRAVAATLARRAADLAWRRAVAVGSR